MKVELLDIESYDGDNVGKYWDDDFSCDIHLFYLISSSSAAFHQQFCEEYQSVLQQSPPRHEACKLSFFPSQVAMAKQLNFPLIRAEDISP